MYISLEDYNGHLPLQNSRDLTDTDITKLASRVSWPHYSAIFYVLGRWPLGESSINNLDPETTKELFDNFIEIMDKFHEARRVGDLNANPDKDLPEQKAGSVFHVKPLEFVTWLHLHNLPCDPRLRHEVVQNEGRKNNRAKLTEDGPETTPVLQLPDRTDSELYELARIYIESNDEADICDVSARAAGARRTGMHIRGFKQKVYYRTLLYVKHGCTCLHPFLVEYIRNDLVNESRTLKKQDKITDYIEEAVTDALELKPETVVRICNKRYPAGKPGAPQSCRFHPKA